MDNALSNLLEAFEQELRSRAKCLEWTPAASPQLLREAPSGAGLDGLVEALDSTRVEPTSHHQRLPEFRRALELQPASLGILLCGLDTEAPDDSYRAALWWTGLVHAEILPWKRSDLHLFLVAPKGTSDEPRWRVRRSRIESDDRFCRKFVWLPSTEPGSGEINTFLDRTFLARPWEGDTAEPWPLDPLERVVAEAPSKNLTQEEARRWIARLGSMDGIQQIAENLADILEGEP